MRIALTDIKFDDRGLLPAIIQDASTLQVLTLGYFNAESLKRTIETGETWFWSRSRSKLWHKGDTSGHKQRVVDLTMDCDLDALRVLVIPAGPACHTGEESCFHNELQLIPSESAGVLPARAAAGAGKQNPGKVLEELYALVSSRKSHKPAGSYTTYLFTEGLDKILKKVGEESTETIIAAKNEDGEALINESCDLLYHLLVLLVECGVNLDQIADELLSRSKETNGSQRD